MTDQDQSPFHTLSSTIAYQTPYMTIQEDDIIQPNGQTGTYSYINHKGAVIIAPFTNQGQLVLVRQWRYPIRAFSWEIPMGGLDATDEPSLTAAQRELMEEAGATSDNWHDLGNLHLYPSMSNEVTNLFAAFDCHLANHTDTNEIAEVRLVKPVEALGMIDDGSIHNGEAVLPILLVQRKWPELFA